MVPATQARRLFGEDGSFQFLDPRCVLVELRLNDLIEAAIDGREAVVHLFAEAADLNMHLTDLIAHVAADVLALRRSEKNRPRGMSAGDRSQVFMFQRNFCLRRCWDCDEGGAICDI
jgi:hypothetical protein